MNESAIPFPGLEALEWHQVHALVARSIASPAGAVEMERVAPSADRARIEQDLAETGEAIEYLRAGLSNATKGGALRINLNGLPDISQSVQKLRIEGAALEPREIFGLIVFLDRAADAKSSLGAASERFPLLAVYAQRIGDFRQVLRDVGGKIQADGSVLDSASPHLNRIRREIEKQKKAIQDSLERFLKANRNEGVLQDEYVTIRNERYVVPVLVGQRRKLPGVIHGASSTGQTLFLEPLDTIDLNNELVRLQDDEGREVLRILRELTDRLRGSADPIREAAAVMARLDVIFAKAGFGLDFDCVIPKFTERKLDIRNARHPLLIDVLRRTGRRVVPFSLSLDTDTRTLLISGPNTGGKTVTLKTVGLIALMAQAGLPVPCSSAELPVFEQVLADIGDHQSIEQNLSTFSAHVARLREMALDATPDSLVLLDEIGSATDPDEGGALGVALVDHFRAAGAFTLASTHLTALKIYGASTKSVLNASMGFDEETLAPTYQLQVGLPGKSAGLDIAARLGMPEHILRRARASLGQRDLELSRLIADLHKRLDETNAAREALDLERQALALRGKQNALEWERKEAARLSELEGRFDTMQRRWQERADETVARIAETADRRKSVDQAQRQSAKFGREMREDWESAVLQKGRETPPAIKVAEGARVRLKGIRDIARVTRLLGHDRIEVAVGFVKMQVALGDVEEVLPESGAPSPPSAPRLPKGVSFQPGPQLNPGEQEINVIGEHVEEAIEKVERFLDAAVMATAARVRIVHGHGMGILRRAIQDLLKQNPHVEKFYPASQYEGGTGATIVELKD